MRYIGITITLFVLVLSLLPSPGMAQTTLDHAEGNFKWTIAPYGWLTGINGTIGAGGHNAAVNVSFADIAKHLNLAGMVHAEVLYRDRFGLLSDFNYSLLGDQASGKSLSLSAQTSLLLADVAAFYRVGTVPMGKTNTASMDFDMLAGARIWNLALKLDGDSRLGERDIYRQRTWADPIIGARATFHLGEPWLASLRGGIGGFSISSAFTWDATAIIGVTFWKHGAFMIGYRAIGVSHHEGHGRCAFLFDTTLSGPILGVTFMF